jgi:NADPH:quinone reductase-like Zn-dependent oxidoreductase
LRALRLVEFGDPPRFELDQVPDLEPGPGEVVIALHAAALNRRDPWVWTTPAYCSLPVTLGSDGAGVVAAVGPGVSHPAVGDEVIFDPTLAWGESDEHPTDAFDIVGAPLDGTFAEQIVVPMANVARKPVRLSWVQAAALNLGGLTAWRATVTCAGAAPGRSILVTGAGSGVSTFAVQIAVALGARVYVTSSTTEKLDRALALGAVGGVSYLDSDWPEQVCELAGGGLDAAIDSYGGPSWDRALRSLRGGGTLVSFGDTSGPATTLTTAEVYWRWRRIVGTSMGSPREYRAMVQHVSEARWEPVIDSVFRLEDYAAAIARLLDPARFGKVVFTV